MSDEAKKAIFNDNALAVKNKNDINKIKSILKSPIELRSSSDIGKLVDLLREQEFFKNLVLKNSDMKDLAS
jgi:hypothetical protein